jgi:hypothetical protein
MEDGKGKKCVFAAESDDQWAVDRNTRLKERTLADFDFGPAANWLNRVQLVFHLQAILVEY